MLELVDVLPETSLTALDLSNCVLARPPLLGREPDLRAVEALGAALKRDDCPLVSLVHQQSGVAWDSRVFPDRLLVSAG